MKNNPTTAEAKVTVSTEHDFEAMTVRCIFTLADGTTKEYTAPIRDTRIEAFIDMRMCGMPIAFYVTEDSKLARLYWNGTTLSTV